MEKDLGIYGNKAEKLLIAYSKRYNVDLSEFNFQTYFSPECISFWRWLYNSKKKKELSVGDLYDGIIKGKLTGWSYDNRMEDLITFIAEQTATKRYKINKNSLLEKDLGLYGDEAEDFIIAYSKKYNVDLSKFHFSLYFSQEYDPMMRGFYKLHKVKELSVADLYEGIKKGELI